MLKRTTVFQINFTKPNGFGGRLHAVERVVADDVDIAMEIFRSCHAYSDKDEVRVKDITEHTKGVMSLP